MKSQMRLWEIDALRGTAIVLMVVLHALVDLHLLGRCSFSFNFSIWYGVQKFTITLFLLLVGISLSLKKHRLKNGANQTGFVGDYIRRGIQLLAWGMIITFSTRIFLSEGFVVFGVLHCIGLSTIIIRPFLRLRKANLLIGLILVWAGLIVNQIHPVWPWLLWLGISPRKFSSVDYVPMLPWFGVILIGIYIGSVFYPGGQRVIRLPDRINQSAVQWLSLMGRHSLLIYLAHQPLILSIYKIMGLI